MNTQFDRPTRFLRWAHETFGDVALDPVERAMRFLEEAVELAHAMGIERSRLDAIGTRVYARPGGDTAREMGQALATLELLAKVTHIDMDFEATVEFHRVHAIPREEWARRHAAKIAVGIAR